MATTEEMGAQFIEFMSSTFGLPTEWFTGALLVFYFLIPLFGLIFVWYTFLYKKLGIFSQSQFANFMIALLISVASSSIIAVLSPTITLAVAIGAGTLLWGRFSLFRIVLALAIAWALTFFYPLLTDIVVAAFPA